MVVFFIWGLLGHLSLLALKTKSLIQNKGQVLSIGVKVERGIRGHKYYPLIISLFTTGGTTRDFNDLKKLKRLFNDFRLKDDFTSQFASIQREIALGDTITIYTRKKWQTILGMGQQDDIYQIEKSNQILFPIEKMIAYQKIQTLLFGLFAFVSLAGYLIYLRLAQIEKRNNKPINANI